MTFRAPAYLACLLALVVLGIALSQGAFDRAPQNAPNDTDGSVSTAVRAAPVAVGRAKPGGASGQPSAPERLSNAGSGQTSQSLVDTHPYGQQPDRAVAPQPNHGGESLNSPSTEIEAEDPNAVIGRPFPVSTSVKATCEFYSGSSGTDCGELYGLLSRMAQEPRDSAWSEAMEAKLRHYLMTVQPGKFSIRALECRTSACAVEVEAAFFHGPFSAVDYKQSVALGLLRRDGMYGYENDQSAGKIRVKLETFERRL